VEHRVDAWLLFAVCAILGASLVTLSTVGPVVGRDLLARQTLWGAAGIAVLWGLSRLRPDAYLRVAAPLYVAGLATLVAVLLIGETRGGTRGWFALGPLTVQPSEFARLATILAIAAWRARREDDRLRLRECGVLVGGVGLAALLVLLEPDLGVALTYLPVLVAALWLGGLPRWAFLAAAVVAVAVAVGAWHTALQPYQKERILTLLDAERDPYGAGYQMRQSKIAVGAGGLVGQGVGGGSQSMLRFLPAQHTDFVFAVWAEATGFLGSTALLLAYALLLFRIGFVAATAESRWGITVTTLVGTWLAFQVMVNVGMVVGILPTTGITLPLFSYGGSSLLTTAAALGVVESVWRHRLVYQ